MFARLALLAAAIILGVGAFSPDAMNTTDNNTTLRNIPSNAAPYITRLGYAAPGDAPPLVFKSSNAACSLSGGNGAAAGMTYSGTPSGKISKNLFTGEVHGAVKLTLTAKGSSTGNAGVSLPAGFSGVSAVGKFTRDQVGSAIWHNGLPGSPVQPFIFGPADAGGLQLLQNGGGGFLTEANFANNTSIQFSW
jgi:hypothetical protein